MNKYIPGLGEKYYHISHCINCTPSILMRRNFDSSDKGYIEEGNCYKTKKQAEEALKEYETEWLKTHNDLIFRELNDN